MLTTGVERKLLAYQDRVIRECEATYDAIAHDYDRHLKDDCGYRSPERVASAVADLASEGRWLDLGAGTGLVGEALHGLGATPEMVAIDVSAAMLERIECPLYVERHQADVLSALPFAAGTFHGAVAAGLMEYILDVRGLMERVAQALAPGGWFVFTFCPNSRPGVEAFDEETDLHCHDARLVKRCLVSSGFAVRNQADFRAYVNGEQGWIRHRMLVAQRVTIGP